MKYVWIMESPFGHLGIIANDTHILDIFIGDLLTKATVKETPLIKETEKQLNEYFAGKRKVFNLPLDLKGTPFQKRVWDELLNIPYGETISYKELAKRVENEKYARAVGMANNKNPIPIIVPCHRVIGSNGKMIGYGLGEDMKIRLLELEKSSL